MKQIFTAIVFFFCSCLTAHATIHNINVENFQFNPSSLNVTVGDTIRWMWDNSGSSHTTTSTSVPSGALSWNHPVDASNQVFDYKVTVPGTYVYHCTIHSGMVGGFTATGTSGVNDFSSVSGYILNNSISDGEINLTINLNEPGFVQLQLYNILGTLVKDLSNEEHTQGVYSETYAVNDLAKGIYLLKAQTHKHIAVKKIIIQ